MHSELTCRFGGRPRALFIALIGRVDPRAPQSSLRLRPPDWCANRAALRSAGTSGPERASSRTSGPMPGLNSHSRGQGARASIG
jgi:hypothetical protein